MDPNHQNSSPIDYFRLGDEPATQSDRTQSPSNNQLLTFPIQSPAQKPKDSKPAPYLLPYQLSESQRAQEKLDAETSKNQVIAQMKVIEKQLDRGWYQWFVVWLYFFVAVAVANFIQSIVYAVDQGSLGTLISAFIVAVWMVNQSMLEISAIKTKNSPKAKRALIFMIIYAIIELAVIIFYILLYTDPSTTAPTHDTSAGLTRSYAIGMVIAYSIGLVLHFVSIYGAYKVRMILKSRNTLRLTLGLSRGLINWTWN